MCEGVDAGVEGDSRQVARERTRSLKSAAKIGTFFMLAETKKREKKREKKEKNRRRRKKVGTLLRPSNSVRVVPKHHHHEWSCAEKMHKIGLFGPKK